MKPLDTILDDEPDMRERQICHIKQLPKIYACIVTLIGFIIFITQFIKDVRAGESIAPLIIVTLTIIFMFGITLLINHFEEKIKNCRKQREEESVS